MRVPQESVNQEIGGPLWLRISRESGYPRVLGSSHNWGLLREILTCPVQQATPIRTSSTATSRWTSCWHAFSGISSLAGAIEGVPARVRQILVASNDVQTSRSLIARHCGTNLPRAESGALSSEKQNCQQHLAVAEAVKRTTSRTSRKSSR